MATGDPAIDAAFADSANASNGQPMTGDQAIDAAFANSPNAANSPSYLKRVGNQIGQTAKIVATHPFTVIPGLLENAVSGATGGVGSLADALTGSQPGDHDWGYRPRTEAGKELAQVGAEQNAEIGKIYDQVAGTGPAATEIKSRIPEALGAVGTIAGIGGVVRGLTSAPGESAAGSASESPQSLGAAKTAPQIGDASPELQRAVREAAQSTGGAVSPEALSRHLEADSLPVKIQLTRGQATQDPAILSNEVNSRGKNPAIAERYNQQNQQLIQNVQALRDQVGPDVFSANPVEHGDTLIDAYKAKDATARAQIDAAYADARNSVSPKAPVLDARALYGKVNAALEDKWATGPSDIMNRLESLAGSGDATINAKQFEGLRTRLADLTRSEDGGTRYAAHLIRGAVEDSDLLPGNENFKASFNQARELARARFQAMEADPAYNAAVNETVSPDRFVQKYIVGGTRDGVATMRQNLADNPTAVQTMGVAALDHLRQSAGVDPMGNGNFSQAGFNKHLQALGPKLGSLVDPKTADQLETLGNVARYTQVQPRGSFVNNSNTFTAMAANHAANALEGMANVKAGGFPVGTMVRKALAGRAQDKATAESLKPGAGLTDLPNPPP